MSARLRVADVSWHVGATPILEGVHFEAQPGELIALMGRNGAGKSSLVDLIAGLRRPSQGLIELDGRPLAAWRASERARAIGHLPQALGTNLSFSAEQLVLMGRYPHADGWFESETDGAAVEDAMRRTSSLEFRNRRVSTLSGGERQRVLLAACLAQSPRLLLLDEPSTFLDVDQQLHVFNLLRDEVRRGTTCITVTHDINLALAFCTRLVVLAERRVAADIMAAEAARDTAWLGLFSPRLSLTTAAPGRAWVTYA
jgi:iron complex transport system ATP-binding protein